MLAAAVEIVRLLLVGLAHIIAAAAASRPRPIQAAPPPPRIAPTPQGGADSRIAQQIAALQNTIDAELALADAARSKAQTEQDPYKRAQWYKRAQDAETRADKALDKINKLRYNSHN